MTAYSRTFLLSLNHWWKYQHQNKLGSAASLPLSTSSWTAIKNLNLLRSRRGKRSGTRRHPAVGFLTSSGLNLQSQSAINNSLQIQYTCTANSSNMMTRFSNQRNLRNLIVVKKKPLKTGSTSFPKLDK